MASNLVPRLPCARASECGDARHARHRSCLWSAPMAGNRYGPPPDRGRCGFPPACLPRLSHRDFEAVVRQADMRRQVDFGPGMRQLVADVGEVRTAWIELFGDADGA